MPRQPVEGRDNTPKRRRPLTRRAARRASSAVASVHIFELEGKAHFTPMAANGESKGRSKPYKNLGAARSAAESAHPGVPIFDAAD